MTSDEKQLIETALKGDSQAFEAVIRHYSRLLFTHAYSILRQAEESEDVVQECLIKAYESKWKVRSAEKFPSWLVSMTRNRAMDILRRRRSVPLPEDHAELEDDRAQKPDQELEKDEVRQKIYKVLDGLPEHHRVAVTLRFLEGMDYEGIEKIMGLSNGALRGILGRAMQVLRSELQPLMN